MLAKLSEIITNFFIKRQVIEMEEKERYCYSFELLLSFLFNLAVAIIIGFATLHFIETIIFLVVFLTIRTTAGGYHADTHFRCTLIFIGVFIAFLAVIDFLHYKYVNIAITIVGALLLMVLPTTDCEENELSVKRKRKLKIKTIIYIIIFSTCSIVGTVFKCDKIALSFSCPMVIIAISIIASYIKKYIRRRIGYEQKER